MAEWKFYGRREQLADLERILDRKRWFFAKVTGRRRIGKTTLIQQAMQELGNQQPVFGCNLRRHAIIVPSGESSAKLVNPSYSPAAL
jgi:predicted AAA+ superfamily ATPase